MVYHIINFSLLNNDIFSLICLSFGQIAPVPIRYIFSTRNSSENWPKIIIWNKYLRRSNLYW